jgi:integrase
VRIAAQTALFLRSIEGDRRYVAYYLIALRGLRRGEAAGLRWCDVDLDGKIAVISQQLQQHGGHLVVCPPKIPHSSRVIAAAQPCTESTTRTQFSRLSFHETFHAPRGIASFGR